MRKWQEIRKNAENAQRENERIKGNMEKKKKRGRDTGIWLLKKLSDEN